MSRPKLTTARLTATGLLALGLGAMFALSTPATAQNKNRAKEVRYLHKLHKANGVNQDNCAQCHQLERNFDVRAPTAANPHQPCATSGCHGEEFFSTKPKICAVCHVDSKPWVKQTAKQKDRRKSEFGGDLSHETHATGRVKATGSGPNGVCRTCHGDVFKGQASGKSGHSACSDCHTRQNQPVMTDCGGCHKLGAKPGRAGGGDGEWAVGELFAHDTHGRDPRKPGTETTCTECHAEITKANNLGEIKNPTMRSCDSCHDGKNAFKTTGFQCYRCHAESAADAGVGAARAAMR
jgi:c(7)-type cytochrome triheme protein